MTHILFTLSIGSWNGKWDGEERIYCKSRSYLAKSETLNNVVSRDRFYYDFGDNWVALVRVKKMNKKEIIKQMKQSAGFCGYDWMIGSIEKYACIRSGT